MSFDTDVRHAESKQERSLQKNCTNKLLKSRKIEMRPSLKFFPHVNLHFSTGIDCNFDGQNKITFLHSMEFGVSRSNPTRFPCSHYSTIHAAHKIQTYKFLLHITL